MNDLVIMERQNIVDIADAIRAKKGTTDILTLEQMAVEIESIEVGSGDATIPENARLYYIGNANSSFDMADLIFESSAVGALSE